MLDYHPLRDYLIEVVNSELYIRLLLLLYCYSVTMVYKCLLVGKLIFMFIHLIVCFSKKPYF